MTNTHGGKFETEGKALHIGVRKHPGMTSRLLSMYVLEIIFSNGRLSKYC